jgi:DNA polymerase-1
MAKSELYWFPMSAIANGAGAFPVHRGQQDTVAIETAVRLAREGNVVAMFPEGTRRAKGLVKRFEARPRTGAARIALEAGVPLVPAAVKGTDKLLRLGKLRVAYGTPVEIDGAGGDDAVDGAHRSAGVVAVSVLLAIDGDSLAHRAYHGGPKTIRNNAVTGFMNWLATLWREETPDVIVVGWDTLTVPTYRHEAFAAYQSGRVFDQSILEQLDLLPEVVRAAGFIAAKGDGYEADDFLAAAAATWPGEVRVVTSDRDAYQLVSDRVTILQPTKGVTDLLRIDPAGVRERYGIDPEQVPDLIALRGDPSDKLPGARGIGPKKAADILREFGTLEAALAAGRFASEAEDLRLYRRIATMDASAPLPPLSPQIPTWAEASSFVRRLGLDRLADRLASLA